MDVSPVQDRGLPWIVIAWMISILSGAAATALLRAPLGGPALAWSSGTSRPTPAQVANLIAYLSTR